MEFSRNTITNLRVVDDRADFLVSSLITYETPVGLDTVVLDNRVESTDKPVGFVHIENHIMSTSVAPIHLDYQRNLVLSSSSSL